MTCSSAAISFLSVLTFALPFSPSTSHADSGKAQTTTSKNKKESEAKVGDKKMANPQVVMETSLGTIELELFRDKAPESVDNFLKYVDEGHYNGTVFHRVISTFMIQGGGFDEKMSQKKTHDPIKNEAKNGLKNERGTLAMARTNEINSATAQFFINVKNNDFLNHQNDANYGYAVFGKVTKGKDLSGKAVDGMEVVDKIKAVPTGFKAGMQDVPNTPVVIKSVKKLPAVDKSNDGVPSV